MSASSARKRCSVNGIQKHVPVDSASKRLVIESPLQPLFDLDQFFSKTDLEDVFIGREWAFREIYESAVVDKIPVTIVEGCRGSGKTTIINQLVLNSSFYSTKTSDTIDSGCVADDGTMWNSRNYEWMRAVAARLVAFHICNIQSSSSCSIPELVCNIGAWLSRSPILKSYTDILKKLDNHLLTNARRSIIDPFGDVVDRILYAANGSMLYIRLLLRLVENGQLSLRYLTQSNLPTGDVNLYGLIMDLTFTLPSMFARVVPVLNILLAALRPLDRSELLAVLNSPNSDVSVTEVELEKILTILSPLLSFASCGSITLHNTALRDWLLTNANHPKLCSDARHGHILLALHLTESAPLDSIRLFELSHHLLKAHPYKYMHGKYIPEFTSSKDGQIHWIKRCSKDIGKALLNHRNMFFPNTKVTQLLLMAGADVNAFDSSSTLTVMQEAVAAGNAHLVSLFLSNGGIVHQPQGESALTIAAKFGHIELLPLLFPLDNTLAIEAALVEGARNGHRKVIRYLLAQNWNNANKRITAIESALIVAAGAGQTKVCELLIDSYGLNDLAKAMCAACEQGRADTVQFFLSRGVSLSSLPWPAERPALICAVESGSWDFVVAVLSQAKCNIECKDAFGRTPIIAAARCMHVGLIDLLLNKGAKIDQQDNRGWSALMHAVSKNHLPSVQLLLDKNAKSSVKDEDGRTLAHIACSSASRLVVDRLLECGMPIEDRDNDGLYPIQIAILRQNRDALESLLTRGARLRTSTWLTAMESFPEVTFILLSKLLDDAGILFRKKRFEDAMHRLHYALNKCELCLDNQKLQDIHSGLTKVRLQIMVSMARVLRRQGRTLQAIEVCSFIEADACERVRFESLLLQAKCHFDLQDLERAKVHARAAVHLRPDHDEARQLLNTLMLPSATIARL
ncbi:unnamed protein product [Angiostrongylus costaricensis]|uniref:ANK_REP_REGION domain-containing protein n=1 Tax=Angiostrongylus costaricensis TaxID=334426 RepID=A0A158PIW2_ANGCS|nr:unnamed protein product [Angiostrongylus costaricensis]